MMRVELTVLCQCQLARGAVCDIAYGGRRAGHQDVPAPLHLESDELIFFLDRAGRVEPDEEGVVGAGRGAGREVWRDGRGLGAHSHA